jgi:hypothetical protein
MHHRHLRPWELFADGDDGPHRAAPKGPFEPFGSGNSYEDEPWVARYERRGLVRKIFDREAWVQEPALRRVQDAIFAQALLGALLATAIVVGVFCAIPRGDMF